MRIPLIAVVLLVAVALPARAQFAVGESLRLHDLARQREAAGDRAGAIEAARAGLARCADQGNRRASCDSALGNVLGAYLLRNGATDEAIPLLRQSVADAVEAYGPLNPVLIARCQWLGRALGQAGKQAEAEAAYREELAVAETAGHAVDVARALNDIATTLHAEGRPRSALPLLQRAENLVRDAGDVDSADYVSVAFGLGSTLIVLGRTGEAERPIRAALAPTLRRGGDPAAVDMLEALATIVARAGDLDTADDLRERALAARRAAPAADTRPLARALTGLGDLRLQQDRIGEAASLYGDAAELARPMPGPTAERAAVKLADARRQLGDLAGAAAALDAIPGLEAAPSMERVNASLLRLRLADAARRPDLAETVIARAEADIGTLSDEGDIVRWLKSLADVELEGPHVADAARVLDRALALLPDAPPSEDRTPVLVARSLAAERSGDLPEAQRWAEAARDTALRYGGHGLLPLRVRVAQLQVRRGAIDQALAEMAAADAFAPDGLTRSWICNERGNLLYDSGRVAESAAQYECALAPLPGLVPPRDRAVRLLNLAAVRRWQKRFDEAGSLLDEADRVARALRPPDRAVLASVLEGEALTRLAAARPEAAEAPGLEAVSLRHRPGMGTASLADTLSLLARIAESMQHLDDAERWRREALATEEAIGGEDAPGVALRLRQLAATITQAGRPAEARPLLRRALEITARGYGNNDPRGADLLAWLALDAGDLDTAERDLVAAMDGAGPEAPEDVTVERLRLLGLIATWSDRFAEAHEQFSRAAAIAGRLPNSAGLVLVRLAQGDLALAEGDRASAAAAFEQASAADVRGSGFRAAVLSAQGDVAAAEGNDAAAGALFAEAFADVRDRLGPESPALAGPLQRQAALARRRGNPAAAVALRRRALALVERYDDRPATLRFAWLSLASDLIATGALDEADALLDRAGAGQFRLTRPAQVALTSVRARLLAARGNDAGAAAATQTLLSSLRAAAGDTRIGQANCFNNLGVFAARMHPGSADAEAFLRQALTMAEAALGPDHPDLAPILWNLAVQLTGSDDAEATTLRARALALSAGRPMVPQRLL